MSNRSMYTKRKYQSTYPSRKPYVSKTKKLVTGQGPKTIDYLMKRRGPVSQLARIVKPMADSPPEQKWHDRGIPVNVVADGTFSIWLSNIPQGTKTLNRIGDRVTLKDLNFKITIISPETTSIPTTYRWMLLVDRFPNQEGLPALNEILNLTSPLSLRYVSQHNKDYTDRFIVLKDKTGTMNFNYANDPVSNVKLYQKCYKKLDFPSQIVGSEPTPTDDAIVMNGVLFIFFADKECSISAASRINFTDN